jgi:D-amino-acid dehydrogenase/Ca-activated chloride channel family protein
VEKPQPSTLAVRYEGKGLPPVLVPAMELVLDCSGSMKDPVEGEAKYLMARRIMHQALDELPDDFRVGLRVFGHMGFWGLGKDKKPGQPADDDPRWNTDSELKIAIGPLGQLGPSKKKTRRQLIKDWINYVKPAGATPLVYSLLQAKKDLSAGWPGPKMVVVVTDGMETCGGKLEDVAAAYKNGGMELVVNIVGFGVPADEEKQLKEIARQAGSKYYDARSARQLAAALQESVLTAYVVSEEKSKAEVARGQVNGDPLSLKPGMYQVRLIGIKSAPVAVEVREAQRLELTLDKEGHLQRPEK